MASPVLKNPDLVLLTEFNLDTPGTDELTRAVRRSKIDGLLRNTGLAARAAANYKALQTAAAERKRMETYGLIELQLEQQRVARAKAKAEAAARVQRAAEERKTLERISRKRASSLVFQPPSKNYYDGKPVAPGLLFFKCLAELAQRGVRIEADVPHMLLFSNGYTWLYSEQGVLRASAEFAVSEFIARFHAPQDIHEVVAALRVTDERGEGTKVTLLNWAEFSEHLQKFTFPTYGLLQQAVKSVAGISSTVRLFHRREKGASTAQSFFYRVAKTKISTNVQDEDLEVTTLGATVVSALSRVGERVAQALDGGLSIRIQLLVLDLIRDLQGTYRLISCKGILFAPETEDMLRRQAERKTLSPQVRKALQSDQLCAMHCKLCLLPYQHYEMAHVLPFRLLMLYKKHVAINSRTLLDLSHIRVNSADFLSHSVPVCELCFMLITTEYELMQAEEHLADLLHIPPDTHSLTVERIVEQPNFMPVAMQQWRLLFYFKSAKSPVPIDAWFMHYTFFGRSHSFRISAQRSSSDCYSVQIARLHYFFAPHTSSLKTVCQSLLLQARCSRNEGALSTVCQGEVHPLRLFTFEMTENTAQFQPLELILFAGESAKVQFQLIVGLACDPPVRVRELPVNIERVGGLYVPEESFKTAAPLPTVWMEMFEDREALQRTEILGYTEEVEALYTPKMKQIEYLGFSTGLDHVLHIGFNLDPLHSHRPFRSRVKHTPAATTSRQQTPIKPVHSHRHAGSLDHEDTLNDLQALIPQVDREPESAGLARTVSEFLTKRPQSVTTRRILWRAQSVAKTTDDRTFAVPTDDLNPLSSGTTVELLQRPPTTARESHRRSSSLSHVTKSLALLRVYGGL